MRWLEPEYPTYKEPLTQYPSIINMTQFGYGRRTCQGQTVTEADLIAGIGAVAWLFDIRKEAKVEKVRKIMKNEKASISQEELITGMSEHSTEDESDDIPQSLIGAFPAPDPEELREQWLKAREKEWEEEKRREKAEDPTLQFTTLLIAKPVPFKFDLSVRNEKRAALVRELFVEHKANGEFGDSKEYCKSTLLVAQMARPS